MREVDFRCLRSAVESLSSSTDLVLANGYVKATLSRQCSPYVSRRGVEYEQIAPIAPEGVIIAANYRQLLVVGADPNAVQEATERGPRPFDDSLLGWDGPRAEWAVERVPVTLLRPVLEISRTYGLLDMDTEWKQPTLWAAWLVPVVMEWDELGRPVFSWPEPPARWWPEIPAEPEPESEPMGQGLPEEV